MDSNYALEMQMQYWNSCIELQKETKPNEAWLIFMDMVNNAIPTFADKTEAFHYFPMWRTWFGLNGLCKLPWNDVEPANNAENDTARNG